LISTALKRASLEDAWDTAKAAAPIDLRKALRDNEKKARAAIAGGSFSQVSANRRSSAFSMAGPGQITPSETVELWRELIDTYDSSKKWLNDCAAIGLDPDEAEVIGFPVGATQVQSPETVAEEDIFNWLMSHMVATSEIRSDFSGLTSTGVPYI
jgi:hypothetical protein